MCFACGRGASEYKRVLEQDPGCHVARDKVPPLEKAVAQRVEKLKEETLGTYSCL